MRHGTLRLSKPSQMSRVQRSASRLGAGVRAAIWRRIADISTVSDGATPTRVKTGDSACFTVEVVGAAGWDSCAGESSELQHGVASGMGQQVQSTTAGHPAGIGPEPSASPRVRARSRRKRAGMEQVAAKPRTVNQAKKLCPKTARANLVAANMESSPPAPSDPAASTEAYLRLLTAHDRWLAAYVYSLVASAADADDILQEVKVTMWKQFGKFQPGSNFRAWARTIATNQILNYRRSSKRREHSLLDEQFIEAVAGEIDRRAEQLDARADALRLCLRKLPEAHRTIVLWRYFEDCGIEEIAAKSARTVEAVYRLLSRIRAVLNECVSRQIAAGASV